DVVVVAERQAALVALAYLGGVVLLPPQRRDGEVVRHHGAVAHQPGLGVAPDDPGADEATGDVAEPAGAEDRADLGGAERDLLVLGLEHALERRLDLLD